MLLIYFFASIKIPTIADGNGAILDNLSEPTKLNQISSIDKTNTNKLIKNQNKMYNSINKFFWSIIGGFIGAIIALLLEKWFKNPFLKIISNDNANQSNFYPQMGGTWKFFRVNVINKPLPKIISWICDRNSAQQVNAKISFIELNKTMKGRWANTLELPSASQSDILRLVFFPEPQTIYAGENEYLDIFVKHEYDNDAYGWNNEAYLATNNWRNKNYTLKPGDYTINISLSGINCQIKKTFHAHIDNTIDQTYIKEVN